MASSVPNLTSILRQTDIEDHEEVLRAADAALKSSKGDLGTQHFKLTALLKLDRFDDAIKVLESGGDKLKNQARLEWAYALYKSGNPGKAAEVAKEGAERGYRHVEAQARYRTENFARAAELYRELSAQLEDDAEADLRINSGAVDAQLEWSGQGELVHKKKPGREDLEAFETAYNAACGSIARGELGQGEVLLKRAKDLCNSLEDLTEVEKQAELLPITVQQVYVLSTQGRLEEAGKLASTVDTKDIPDASTRHIARVNNLASAPKPINPFMVQRLLDLPLNSLKPDVPFKHQIAILQQNRYASDLQSSKFGGMAASTQAAIAKYPAPTTDPLCNSLSVINAAAHAKNQTGKEGLKHIVPLLEKRPNDVGLILTIVQLYVLTNNHASAISLLETFFSRLEKSAKEEELAVRFAPGLVGTLVSLYTSQRRTGHARSALAKAAKYWRRKPKKPLPSVAYLLNAAGTALLDSQDPEHESLAKDIFTNLHQHRQDDRYAAAGLLAADPSSSTIAHSLTPVDRLIAGIDAEALEAAGVAQPPSSTAPVSTKRKAEPDTKPKKKKKLTSSRRPRDFDPSKVVDPERWLPLRDRSTYRPKGKKGKARQNMLSQGAVANESDGSRPATPGAEVVKGKQSSGGGGGQKKKKGKGGKR